MLAGNEIRASENEIQPAIKSSTRMQLLKPLRNITKVDVGSLFLPLVTVPCNSVQLISFSLKPLHRMCTEI